LITKLTITPCNVDDTGTVTSVRQGEKFEVQLNPSDFKLGQGIKYSTENVLGQPAKAPKFKGSEDETMSFDIVLDATGVVEDSQDIMSQIESLNQVCYKYVGDKHQPNVVQLVWGSFKFNGRLTTMNTNFTLFKPSGEPLRAKIALKFTNYISVKEEAAKTKRSSPDLTHLVEVKAGDSLPLLCDRIYQNSSYYLEVAKVNGITNFRNIKPGSRLNFPPLR